MTNRTQPETPVGGPRGDTGGGTTGVPDEEQGISNRPGDRSEEADSAADAEADDELDIEDMAGDLEDDIDTTGHGLK